MKFYVHVVYFYFYACKTKCIYVQHINTFNLQDTQFQLTYEKSLVKILGFEISFNQLMDKVRKNVKLSEYLPSVKLD